MKQLILILSLLAGILSGLAASACDTSSSSDENTLRVDGTPAVQIRFVPAQFSVGESFALEISLCDSTLSFLGVDAGMPSHGHGMNYRPSVTTTDTGLIRAEGFLFHMPGAWQITLDVARGESKWQLVREYELQP